MSIAARNRDARYIEAYNGTGSTIAAYLGVRGSPTAIALPSGVTSPCFGVTARDIPTTERGDVQYAGVAIATAAEAWDATALAAGVRVYVDTAGKMAVWDAGAGVNQSVFGLALTVSSGDGALVEILIGAGGIGQGA
jgi:predicted RecA/RadA family phage recombinase